MKASMNPIFGNFGDNSICVAGSRLVRASYGRAGRECELCRAQANESSAATKHSEIG